MTRTLKLPATEVAHKIVHQNSWIKTPRRRTKISTEKNRLSARDDGRQEKAITAQAKIKIGVLPSFLSLSSGRTTARKDAKIAIGIQAVSRAGTTS